MLERSHWVLEKPKYLAGLFVAFIGANHHFPTLGFYELESVTSLLTPQIWDIYLAPKGSY